MILNVNSTAYEADIASVRVFTATRPHYATVITFGCQQNEADSELIKGILSSAGYILTDSTDMADIIIVNTCTIREHAQMKALSLIGRFKALRKKNPELIVGICGCMAAEKGASELLKNDFHYVSFTLQPGMLRKLPELILKAHNERQRSFVLGMDEHDIEEGIPAVRSSGHKAWVSIMYGCNNFCSYCIVPYVRGRERSRRSGDIISECVSLISGGVKELTLLGQNVNSYHSDMDFAELLEKISEIPGDFIIRFMTSHPKDVSDALISVIAQSGGKIAPYFHLPLQSGSDRILKLMNRTYDREKFLRTVNKLREKVPGIAISTDVIVGFPGESEEDFDDTLDMLSRVRFDMVYSFLYSPREGTRASKMGEQVPQSVKSARMERLLELQNVISLEKNLPLVGKHMRVLVDSVSKKQNKNTYTARTDTNKLVHFVSDRDLVGNFIDVEIEKVGAFDLYGKIIKTNTRSNTEND